MEIQNGKIILILGPVFSGKTTKLIDMIKKYEYKDEKTIIIKHSETHKNKSENEIITHDQIKQNAVSCSSLKEIFNILKNYNIIGIDDGHFFEDIVDICEELSLLGKTIVVTALNGDYKMEPFSNIERLVSKINKIKLLHAYCSYCHKKAGFSLRVEQNKEKENFFIYKPVCKLCHFNYHKNEFSHSLEENEEQNFMEFQKNKMISDKSFQIAVSSL